MAKHRRRFYLAVCQGNRRKILSLKFEPTNEIARNTDICVIFGPYRTMELAVAARDTQNFRQLWFANMVNGHLYIQNPLKWIRSYRKTTDGKFTSSLEPWGIY